MQSYEPALWRTDLIVFVQNDESHLKKIKTFFNDLDCLFTNRRKSANEKPMCTLIDYMPISKRKLPQHNNTILEIESTLDPKKILKYKYLLEKVNIYSDDGTNLLPFYSLLQIKLSKYGYLDSIVMAFDGYQ
jgi:hypothetical protein